MHGTLASVELDLGLQCIAADVGATSHIAQIIGTAVFGVHNALVLVEVALLRTIFHQRGSSQVHRWNADDVCAGSYCPGW